MRKLSWCFEFQAHPFQTFSRIVLLQDILMRLRFIWNTVNYVRNVLCQLSWMFLSKKHLENDVTMFHKAIDEIFVTNSGLPWDECRKIYLNNNALESQKKSVKPHVCSLTLSLERESNVIIVRRLCWITVAIENTWRCRRQNKASK